MASHVSQRAAAENEPAAPGKGQVRGTIGPHALDPQPEIPIERLRHGFLVGERLHPLRPYRAIGPRMNLRDIADRARPDDFTTLARALVRVALITHLRGNFVFNGGV